MSIRRYTWGEFDKAVVKISLDIYKSGFKPKTIIGIQRGGLPLAVSLSHCLSCDLAVIHTKEVHPFDNLDIDWESPILVVDDINDSGITFNEVKNKINNIIYVNTLRDQVRYACLVNNIASSFTGIDYSGEEFNKLENPSWVVFPWEEPFNKSI